MKAPSSLQRGMACLCCRKRKMKCDGARPVCLQCSKANRAAECQYYEKKRTSRTQILQTKIAKLEARLRELESEHSESSASSSSQSPPSQSGFTMEDPQPSTSTSAPLQASSLSTAFDENYFSTDVFSEFSAEDLTFPLFDPVQSHVSWPGGTLDIPAILDEASTSANSFMSVAPNFPHASSNWWENNDIFCENKQTLLDIFFSHRQQCAFDVHEGRFRASLLLPTSQQPHPAVVDAIFLLACYFSRSPPLAELESHFLKSSLKGIADALQHSDRIINVLQASCLIAVYFFSRGRTMEGYYHSSIAARLAVGLGLHQIRSNEWFQYQFALAGYQQEAASPLKAAVPLAPPLDAIEYAERVAAFWQIFAVDRSWSVATGLPTALPDDDHPRARIETIWPIPIPDIPPESGGNAVLSREANLFGSTSTTTLRVKAIALFERTTRFSVAPMQDEKYWYEHRSLEMSLVQFSANLPSLGGGFQSPFTTTDVDLVNVHTLMHAATIQLHRNLVKSQAQSFEKVSLGGADDDEHGPSTCWQCAADMYGSMLSSSPLYPAVDIIAQDLDMLVAAMRRLSCMFPIAGIHASKIERSRSVAHQSIIL
ncbi:Nitrogen assimilation transcription factor nirA [Grifola frondosa]|uniref:Nitrogen assimilation transcription factor nirA n=1 Tax=Grifola frondosa TaxID=5627 RepID=A0A1C7MGM5_GRIFR|nr:Nitrogen assimilation transcription factor nirA [Grifola frondosa]